MVRVLQAGPHGRPRAGGHGVMVWWARKLGALAAFSGIVLLLSGCGSLISAPTSLLAAPCQTSQSGFGCLAPGQTSPWGGTCGSRPSPVPWLVTRPQKKTLESHHSRA